MTLIRAGARLIPLFLLSWSSIAVEIVTEEIPIDKRIDALASGGHLLVMRHVATDHNKKDIDRSPTPDCSRQRDVSEQGIADAMTIRQSLKQFDIPIGKVYSSPYCRASNTARLAFGDYEVDNLLQFSISKTRQESAKLALYLREQLTNADPGASNIVFVTHTSNIRDATGIWPKPEGVALVFKKEGAVLKYRGSIAPADWPVR